MHQMLEQEKVAFQVVPGDRLVEEMEVLLGGKAHRLEGIEACCLDLGRESEAFLDLLQELSRA